MAKKKSNCSRSGDAIEHDIHAHLIAAWNDFCLLKPNHPYHKPEFIMGIHECQKVLMWRECQRRNPSKYPIIES